MRRRHQLITSIITLALIVGACVAGLGPEARAQSDDTPWTEPLNLSRSGAASQPVLVSGQEGVLQAFWWDQFDGVMTATYEGGEWSSATQASIIVTTVVGQGQNAQTLSTPVEEMPSIAGGTGYAHALWRGEPDGDTGIVPLMYSRLAIRTSDWSSPRAIRESVPAWKMTTGPDGVVHLIYIRAQHSDRLPAGVYHMRSTDAGASWSAPQALYESAYVRLLDPEETHLWMSTGAEADVYAAWDDPRLRKTFVARSSDSGASWEEAQTIGDADDGARRARVIPSQGDPLLLWEANRAATGCGLYQERLVTTTEAITVTAPERVLDDLRACPEAPAVHRTAEGDPLLIVGTGSGSLSAVAWDGAQWSELKWLSFSFEHPELERQVYLDGLHTALQDGHLGVVGVGQDGDVWYLESEAQAWEWVFAPPSPWSGPEEVSASEGIPGQPAVTVDTEGQVHVLWSATPRQGVSESALVYARRSEDRWSRPARVLQSPEGVAEQPALVAAGGRLHAVWSGGPGGPCYHSWAYVGDAHSPDGWSEPLPMAGATSGSPDVLVDANGALHVVYAVPLNEGRGIYYVRSEDSGETWSGPQVVFDAAAAGWGMADHPTLAIDPAGTLHVAFVRGSAEGPFSPQGIFYAGSTDGGWTWFEPRAMAEAANDWPRMAAPLAGQAHLLWNEVRDGGGCLHRWSADHGGSWSRQQEVPGFRDVTGPAGLTADGAGTLHLVGLGRDDAGEPALLYTEWDGSAALTGGEGHWDEQDTFRLDLVEDFVPGPAVALAGAQGRLSVTFRAEVKSEQGLRQPVFHASRGVPAVESAPEPLYTPIPAATPTPTPMPTPTATPRPAVPAERPEPGPPVLDLGPLTLPITALGGLALGTLIVVGVLAGRGLSERRR